MAPPLTGKSLILHPPTEGEGSMRSSRSRAVDALVLPIFEGVKPILELKVIARGLLGERGG